jgi:hypothetical protein
LTLAWKYNLLKFIALNRLSISLGPLRIIAVYSAQNKAIIILLRPLLHTFIITISTLTLTSILALILTVLLITSIITPSAIFQHQHISIRPLSGIPPSLVPSPATGKPRSIPPSNAGSIPGSLNLPRASSGLNSTMSGGWNPITGRDSGSGRPTFSPYGAPQPAQGQAYIPHAGGPGYNFGTVPQYTTWPNTAYGYYPIGAGQGFPQYGMHAQGAYAGYHAPQTFAYQPNGTGNLLPRQPQPYPNIDPTMPAAQMTNTTGGTGCEPGYNYFFPAEHTKAHIFKTNTPPWQLPPTAQIPFKAAHIPCNTTMAELLKGFGCNNPTPKKNKCFEVVSGGGGKWYKGLEVNGADKDLLKKTIKDVGWDSTRTGNPNEKPVVCLWFCKD